MSKGTSQEDREIRKDFQVPTYPVLIHQTGLGDMIAVQGLRDGFTVPI